LHERHVEIHLLVFRLPSSEYHRQLSAAAATDLRVPFTLEIHAASSGSSDGTAAPLRAMQTGRRRAMTRATAVPRIAVRISRRGPEKMNPVSIARPLRARPGVRSRHAQRRFARATGVLRFVAARKSHRLCLVMGLWLVRNGRRSQPCRGFSNFVGHPGADDLRVSSFVHIQHHWTRQIEARLTYLGMLHASSVRDRGDGPVEIRIHLPTWPSSDHTRDLRRPHRCCLPVEDLKMY